ncbi:MAG: helix-turn-helix transcriptional regulator [Cyanobacteria bacterium J06623_7]
MTKAKPDEQDFSIELKRRFSLCLKRVMFEFDLSNKDLAANSGVDSTYISHLRSGKRLPNFENFMKILESLPYEAQEYFKDLLFNQKHDLKVVEKANIYKV